ncbi:DUF4184 family protein [Luteolibacter flavescens]|uniref:DUF4184 family protein n=1 Tax=Luteolibacter flavescens TaxID=1859460 RepID=UPI0031B9FD0A
MLAENSRDVHTPLTNSGLNSPCLHSLRKKGIHERSVPFILSHPAAVLPFLRWRRFDPLALVVGSMAPDFGYFLHRFALAGEDHMVGVAAALAVMPSWNSVAGFDRLFPDPRVRLPMDREFHRTDDCRLLHRGVGPVSPGPDASARLHFGSFSRHQERAMSA